MRNKRSDTVCINAVLLLDKPIEMTSNHALQVVKRLFNARKAGHTGSLDPLATGMLPICFGEATKFAQFLLDTDKRYRVTAKLGIKTETGDVEGAAVYNKPVPDFTDDDIESVLQKFRGPIEQIPSMYSAIKHNGQPLYKLAREGEVVEREKRPVTIHSLVLLNRTHDTLELDVHSSKGTYIRTLVEDIGEELQCGAHVIELRRLRVGDYQEKDMVTLAELESLVNSGEMSKMKDYLLPIESMFAGLNVLQISESLVFYMRQGQPVIVPHAPTSGLVQLQSKDGKFLGIGEILSDARVAPKKIIN